MERHVESRYREVREGTCAVPDCGEVCVLATSWGELCAQVRGFNHQHQCGTLPAGWHYVRGGWIAHGVRSPIRDALFCPAHSPTWLAWVGRVRAWDLERRAERKTLLMRFASNLGWGSAPQPPPPFAR